MTEIATNFAGINYLLALPMMLLTLFAIGILLIDLMLPPEWKWTNAATALAGVAFATGGVLQIQRFFNAHGLTMQPAFGVTLLVDRVAIYFFYLFLAGTAVAA